MRKRTGRLGGRGAPGSARAAILNFLAGLDGPELRPLLLLVLGPLGTAFVPDMVAGDAATASVASDIQPWAIRTTQQLFEEQGWGSELGQRGCEWWLRHIDMGTLGALPARTCLGFLNAAADLLRHLGHRLEAFLPELGTLLVLLLGSAGNEHGKRKHVAEERQRALRLLAEIWRRFPGTVGWTPLWPVFFTSVAPLMPRMRAEVCCIDCVRLLILCIYRTT